MLDLYIILLAVFLVQLTGGLNVKMNDMKMNSKFKITTKTFLYNPSGRCFTSTKIIPYWPLFNRPLRTKRTFKFLSKVPAKLKAGQVILFLAFSMRCI